MHHCSMLYRAVSRRAVSRRAATVFLACFGLVGALVVTHHPDARAADVEWNPPAEYAAALDAVWARSERINPGYPGENLFFDQLIKNDGVLKYCVVWQASSPATPAERDQVATILDTTLKGWTSAIGDWGGWPHPQARAEVIGWAAKDQSKLQWTDGVPTVEGDMCPGAGPNAPGAGPTLWLNDGMGDGSGANGNNTGTTMPASTLLGGGSGILAHEMGHGFGLDDFYDYDPGVGGFIMMAGSAGTVTEFDAWMARNVWRHIKARNGR